MYIVPSSTIKASYWGETSTSTSLISPCPVTQVQGVFISTVFLSGDSAALAMAGNVRRFMGLARQKELGHSWYWPFNLLAYGVYCGDCHLIVGLLHFNCMCLYVGVSAVVVRSPCDLSQKVFRVNYPSQYFSGRTLPSKCCLALPKIVPPAEGQGSRFIS